MNVQLRWTDADAVSAHWAYLRHNIWGFVRYFRYSITAIAVSAVVLFQYPESWQIVGWLVLLDIATITYQLLLFRRNSIRRFKNSRLWQDMVSVAIDGKSIRFAGQGFDKARGWPEFSDVFESRRVFMFGTTDRKVLFLPKTGMNESQIAELRALITTYATRKVRLARS